MERIVDNVFRLNPLFSLIPCEHLDDKQKKWLNRVIKKNTIYGLLQPLPEVRLTVKAVNRDLAVLLQQLLEPKKLSSVFRSLGEQVKEEDEHYIIRLVLDNVLEVQHGNKFISGVDAVNRILSPSSPFPYSRDQSGTQNHIQDLSHRALYFAANSALVHPRDISLVLYNFNRIPLSRRWKQRFPSERALATYLELSDDGSWKGMSNRVLPRTGQTETTDKPAHFDSYWRGWYFGEKRPSDDRPSYKVYLSPLPENLPQVFRIVRQAASFSDAHFMKIGRNVQDILRADKLLVYFAEYRHALNFAHEMSESLISYRYQGTPFTYQVHPDNPLVSMGVDPPRTFRRLFSWRLYMTSKLALAIQGARTSGTKNVTDYIHSYMNILGIDSVNWCPLNKDWNIVFRAEEKGNG